jgi:capsular exopolysaccharide synthesis family protein
MEALPGQVQVMMDPAADVDLRRVWATVARSAWLILGCVLLALGAGVVAVRRMEPVYQATASIRLDPRGATNPAAALYGVTSDNANLMATAMEVITSRSLAHDVVDSLGLRLRLDEPRRLPRSAVVEIAHVDSAAPVASYRLMPAARGAVSVRDASNRTLGTYPEHGVVVLPGATLRVVPASLPAAGALVRIASAEEVMGTVRGHVTALQPNNLANILTVTFEGNDPILVRDVSNVLASRFVKRRLEAEKSGARSTVELLHRQLDTLTSDMRLRENDVTAFLQSHHIVSVANEESQQSAELQHLVDLRIGYAVDRQAMVASLQELEASKEPGDARTAVERVLSTPAFLRVQGTASPTTEFIARLHKQEDDLDAAKRRLSPTDPDVVLLEKQITATKYDVSTTVRNFIAGMGEQIRGIDQRIATLRAAVQKIPEQQAEFQRLTRGQKAVEDIMNQVQSHLKEAEISASVQDSTAEVLDRAVLPGASLGTSRPVIFAVALFSGLIVGVAVAFLRDWLDTTVHNEADVTAITGAPVIGIIPNLRQDALTARYRSLVNREFPALGLPSGKATHEGENQTMAAEAYRALRTNLSYVSPAKPPRVIVLTSALSGDGKTTSAANLAVTLAQQNKRVLLIDAETRRGNLHTLFGIEAQPGFFDLLYGQATPGECIRRVVLEGAGHLDVLPSGGAPNANAADLLVASRLAPFFERLRMQYDYVLIDTPPLNLFTDAALIGAHADATLLIARADRTERQALRFAVLQLQHVQANLAGAILNGVDLRRNSRYRGGYDFGRYGAYYS